MTQGYLFSPKPVERFVIQKYDHIRGLQKSLMATVVQSTASAPPPDMCRWCRKLEPILARDSYPFPLRPLTLKLHALHHAASHRLGIFYRNRLMLMNDLLPLLQPLEKHHLDLGLVEEVRDEILYLQRALDKHPVERDEERGWDAIQGKGDKGKGKLKQGELVKEEEKEGEDGEEGSEVGNERSRTAVVSGRGRENEHKDEEGSADSDGEEEADLRPPDYASTHLSHAKPADIITRPSIGASTHASEPRPATTPNPNTHTRPHTPKSAPNNQSKNQPRSKIHNPRRAYIANLVAAKVVEHLERQERAASTFCSRGWGEALHNVPANTGERKGASHLPPQATTSALCVGKEQAAAVSTNADPFRSQGRRVLAWVREVGRTVLEAQTPAPVREPKSEKREGRYRHGLRAMESVGASRRGERKGEGVGRGSQHGSDEADEEEDGSEGVYGRSAVGHGYGRRQDGADRDGTLPGISVGTGVWI